MKKYIVIYNKNSRGKTYSKQDLEMIFSSHDLDSKIFVTNEIKQVDKIVKNFKKNTDFLYNFFYSCVLRRKRKYN